MSPPQNLATKRSFVITLGLLTGLAALTVDLSLPAVPAMVEALTTTLPTGQLIVGVFMAGMAVGQIPAGLFSDRAGRLPALYLGLALFLLGTIASSIATSIEIMLAARFVQGVGAAAAIVLSRAIVRDVASGQRAARLMSLMMMIFTVAPVIAPSFGALLVSVWGWRAPFFAITVLGSCVIVATRLTIPETHRPVRVVHPARQLLMSFREFFSHRQCVFALLLIILPAAGYLSVIAIAAALTVDIYGYSITTFGLLFAGFGVSILIGAFVNRLLVDRLNALQLLTLGVALLFLSSAQLLLFAILDEAPFAWLWSCVCLYMFTIAILAPNATVIALDPLPSIAGVASSIIGTLQNVLGAGGAMLSALIYDGSVRHAVIIIAIAGLATVLVFVARPLLAPGPLRHYSDELAGDA